MMREIPDLLQGALDLLILKALQRGSTHGFGISVLVRQMPKEVLQWNRPDGRAEIRMKRMREMIP